MLEFDPRQVALAAHVNAAMAAIVSPMTGALVSMLVGVPLHLPPDAMISRVISETIGIAKRRRMNDERMALMVRVVAAFPDEDARRHIALQAVRDTTVQGCPVARGAVVNCDMTSLETGVDADHARFFGAGMHACLGRRLTLELFAAIAPAMAGVTTRLTDIRMTPRRDNVFAIPDTICITITT